MARDQLQTRKASYQLKHFVRRAHGIGGVRLTSRPDVHCDHELALECVKDWRKSRVSQVDALEEWVDLHAFEVVVSEARDDALRRQLRMHCAKADESRLIQACGEAVRRLDVFGRAGYGQADRPVDAGAIHGRGQAVRGSIAMTFYVGQDARERAVRACIGPYVRVAVDDH